MKVFKQSYQVKIIGGALECQIVLEPMSKLSYADIESLTGGILPYSIRFWYIGDKKRWYFDYFQRNGVYKSLNSNCVSIPYGVAVDGKVTLHGHSADCMDDFGVVNVGINTTPDKVVLYGCKSFFGSYTFDSDRESAVSTHKITITSNGYEIVGLGADKYCRVLDKASKYYGKLFSEVEDKEYLMQYYWKYRKKRCIEMDALASALGQSRMGGTSYMYCPKFICED